MVDVATGKETRLTQGGSDTLLNGRLDWVYTEELNSRSAQAFAWSPDSKAIAYLQLDQSRVPTFPIVDFLPVRNEVEWQRYPKAGAPNSVVRLGVVGIARDGTPGPERLVSFEPDDVYVLPQLGWTADSRHVAFQHMNRAQDQLELRLLPVPSSPRDPLGTPRTVLTERSKTWLNTFEAPRFLRDGRRFLWLSERDGFAHVYLCDVAGPCRPVTQGSWAVDAAVSFMGAGPGLVLDERTGFLYFTANEKDARERHLYRIRLDGTGRARLTREDGTHRTVVSPDGRFYADTWSDARTPPKLWVTSQDGTRRWTVEENANPPILGFERASLEFVDVKAKDGTTLHASLVKPADFDPSKRYPVVVRVYGGPHAQDVRNQWGQVSPTEHLYASHGFLVFKLDNRGTSMRGTAFESATHRDLGRVELEDQLQGVEYLEALPYVDPARIGITGGSYGGYMTLYAPHERPGRLPGRGRRVLGDRLDVLRLRLHRAVHGDAGGQPEGLRDQLAPREGGTAEGRPPPHPRLGRRQRPPREHHGVRRRPHQGGQAVRAQGPPAAAPRVPAEGGPHREGPRDPGALREDAPARIPRRFARRPVGGRAVNPSSARPGRPAGAARRPPRSAPRAPSRPTRREWARPRSPRPAAPGIGPPAQSPASTAR